MFKRRHHNNYAWNLNQRSPHQAPQAATPRVLAAALAAYEALNARGELPPDKLRVKSSQQIASAVVGYATASNTLKAAIQADLAAHNLKNRTVQPVRAKHAFDRRTPEAKNGHLNLATEETKDKKQEDVKGSDAVPVSLVSPVEAILANANVAVTKRSTEARIINWAIDDADLERQRRIFSEHERRTKRHKREAERLADINVSPEQPKMGWVVRLNQELLLSLDPAS